MVVTNVRALEGALIRAVALASLHGRPLDEAIARESLARTVASGVQPLPVTIATVQEAACTHFVLSADKLISRSRVARVALARHVAMYLASELTRPFPPARLAASSVAAITRRSCTPGGACLRRLSTALRPSATSRRSRSCSKPPRNHSDRRSAHMFCTRTVPATWEHARVAHIFTATITPSSLTTVERCA